VPPRREPLFLAVLDAELPEREAPPRDALREPPRFEALLRFIVLLFAVLRLAELFFAVLRLAELRLAVLRFEAPFVALRLAPLRLAALFLAPPRLAVLFLPPERLLIAGPRRVLFFPALRFVPRPDFFVAIAASPRRK
jgi:hypothetical protein